MDLANLIRTEVPVISDIATIETAARLMQQHNTRFLPVIVGDKLVGTLSSDDILFRGIAQGEDLLWARVRDFMERPAPKCLQSWSVRQSLDMMVREGFSVLPVVDHDERYVGIVAKEDLVEAFDRLPSVVPSIAA